MQKIPSYVSNYKAVVDFYGFWPWFHDANVPVYEAHDAQSDTLRFTLHTWQMTNEVDAKGFFVLKNHALVSFRFKGIYNVEMDNFRSGNILSALQFFPSKDLSSFKVELDSVMDMSGSFFASSGEVVSIVPCTADGKELHSPS